MINANAMPHIPNATCEMYEERMLQELVLHLRTLEHHLFLHIDRCRLELSGREAGRRLVELFHRMSCATAVLPSGTYTTRNPNDFAL